MKKKKNRSELLLGDCLEVLKMIPDNSVDSIVTDPPYGLSFMGKKWDYDVPSTEIWKEALRVLKPGGHLLAFFGTRTYHRGVIRIEDAGFEIRDCIQWIYGSGFPKSHNLKDAHEGWGTALKPANEPIVMARKPLEKGLTVAQNVLKWGTGAINIDGTRIDLKDGETTHGSGKSQSNNPITAFGDMGEKRVGVPHIKSTQGRWPANIIFDEEAAQMLDGQSGEVKSAGKYKDIDSAKEGGNGMFAGGRITNAYAGETGGPSRFFYVAKASKRERNAGLEGMPTKVLATSTGQTRPGSPARLGADPHSIQDPVANHHPTVKPIKLMEYLITLVTPLNGSVLDPFMGSGSTGVAAKNLHREFIGIEMNEEYFAIAERRFNGTSNKA